MAYGVRELKRLGPARFVAGVNDVCTNPGIAEMAGMLAETPDAAWRERAAKLTIHASRLHRRCDGCCCAHAWSEARLSVASGDRDRLRLAVQASCNIPAVSWLGATRLWDGRDYVDGGLGSRGGHRPRFADAPRALLELVAPEDGEADGLTLLDITATTAELSELLEGVAAAAGAMLRGALPRPGEGPVAPPGAFAKLTPRAVARRRSLVRQRSSSDSHPINRLVRKLTGKMIQARLSNSLVSEQSLGG